MSTLKLAKEISVIRQLADYNTILMFWAILGQPVRLWRKGFNGFVKYVSRKGFKL